MLDQFIRKVLAHHKAIEPGDLNCIPLSTRLPKPCASFVRRAKVTTLANPAIQLAVIAETPDYIVLNKPAGIVVHQAEQHLEPDTIVNGLLACYPELVDVGEDPMRPGIIHRLDQHVSGVLVVARTQAMFLHLKDQWQRHLVRKQYIALVHGKMSRTDGEINFSIARSSQQFTKMAARPDASGKAAVTRYSVLQQYQRYALQM